MKQVALQLYSIRERMAQDVRQTLLETAHAGYSGVEFAGYFNHSAEEIRSFLDEAGLACAGTHIGLATLAPDTIEETIRFNQAIGNTLLIVPGVPREMYSSYDACARLGETLDGIGKRLKSDGMTLYYHNHHLEFQVYDGKYGLDIMFENADPAHLSMELDCYWAHIAGVDPLAYIKKYGSRCSLLHMKDRKADDQDKVAQGVYECTEVGSGVIDFPSIIALGKEIGVRWYIVEQESFDRPMLESIALSAQYLNKTL